jgi:hypothetical protein
MKRHVAYMSRLTAKMIWPLLYGVDPDLTSDMRMGNERVLVLFDDRLSPGIVSFEHEAQPD